MLFVIFNRIHLLNINIKLNLYIYLKRVKQNPIFLLMDNNGNKEITGGIAVLIILYLY